MTADSPLSELVELLSAITAAAEEFFDSEQSEDLLVDLRDLLRSGRVDRADAVSELVRLSTEWPPGADEALEFTMHELRWPEVREALDDHRMSGADFRTRDRAAVVLRAFEDDWPDGEIYRTYRPDDF